MDLNELASEVARRAATKNINLDVIHVKSTLRQLSEVLCELQVTDLIPIILKLTHPK